MSQPMGTFVPKPAQQGDAFQARFAVGRPLIVQVVGVDGARSVTDPNTKQQAIKKAVTVHVWDLLGGQISVNEQNMPVQGAPNTVYCNVSWMAGAVVDNLEGFVGAPAMPLKLVNKRNKSNTFFYVTPEAIEGPELQQVQAFFAQDPTRIDREVAAKAQANAAQAAAPQYQATGFQPLQVQPSQPQVLNGLPGQQAMANAQYNGQQIAAQAPAAAQFQAPPGQPGAIAQMPAQVAQQYAPVDQAAQQQFQQPAIAPNGMTPGAMVNTGQMTPAQAVQAYQQPGAQLVPNGAPPWNQTPGQPQPQFQQPGTPGAVGGQLGHVQNSDVAHILQGLAAGQQPGQ